MSLLQVDGVSKNFGPVAALNSVSLEVLPGSKTAVVGPSGSGKSTLLRIIAGFDIADRGRVALDGAPLVDDGRVIPAHLRQIGIVSQEGALFPHLSVFQNIAFGLDGPRAEKQARVQELIEVVELETSMLARAPHQLSGGQQQRVALARALARRPKLMLLDEPFSALDAGLREHMRRAVARILAQADMTAILVTHDQSEALSFADQVAVLRAGKLVQAGSPQDLYYRPRDRETALFLGDGVVLEATLDGKSAECVLGRIPLDAPGIQGDGLILVRPEQLELATDRIARQTSVGCPGQVTYVEFGGASWTVAVSLAGSTPVQLKLNTATPPAVGDHVRINIKGQAHRLES